MRDRGYNGKDQRTLSLVENNSIDHEDAWRVPTRIRENLDPQFEMFPADLQTMMKYVHTHLFEKTLTVGKVKRQCRQANNNIVTRFRMTVGMGVREYIVNQRLKAAASILCNTQVNIYFVASSIGYTEEAFSRLFKKTYGCTPSEYRRERRGQNGQEE